ncbi:MAG: hypothetical protein H7844_01630 [Nitrospirae bacterium YQR-1]
MVKEYIKSLTKYFRGDRSAPGSRFSGLKKHRKDIVILLVLLSLMPLLAVKKPNAGYSPKGGGDNNTYIDKKTLLGMVSGGIDKQYPIINERNIFSQDGKYEPDAPPKSARTYTLVGIIRAKANQVFLVDNLGTTYVVKQGDKLEDGSEVAGVDNISVVLRNGREEKRLKILTVENK